MKWGGKKNVVECDCDEVVAVEGECDCDEVLEEVVAVEGECDCDEEVALVKGSPSFVA